MKKKTEQEIIQLEKELAEYKGEDRVVSSTEIWEEYKKLPERKRLECGFPSLDKWFNGFEVGELILVTGPADGGKTNFLTSSLKNMSAKSIPTLLFSFEEAPQNLLKKITREDSVPPVFYVPRQMTENTILWMEKKIIEAKVKFNVEAVFIDNIHQIFSINQFVKNLSLEIGDMVAYIKNICLTHCVVIFMIAHSRDNPNKSEPVLSDIRDSGLIPRIADSAIGVWRIPNSEGVVKDGRYMSEVGPEDNKAKIRILKNRREGTKGTCVVYHHNHFLEEQKSKDELGNW